MDFGQALTKNWTQEAASYSKSVQDDLETQMRRTWTEVVLQHLPEKPVLDILDIGTGPGFFPIILSHAGHRVTGIDYVAGMLEEAKQNAEAEGVTPLFLQADGQKLPFVDGSFDCVISRNVAWTLEDAEQAYREWLRVLRPGGRILIFDANWNLRYHDEKKMAEYIEDQKRYAELFHKEPDYYSPEAEAYRKSAPMCSRIRPQWDITTLLNLGVKVISCDGNIYQKVWDEERKVKYRSTPMFLITAEKSL